MKNQRKLLVVMGLMLIGTAVFWSGCSKARDPWADVPGTGPKVLVSFPPLYCFTREVAGDHAQVLSMLTTTGPHDYQPVAADALKAVEADLFLVNGLGLDEFVATIKNSSGNKKLKVVPIGDEIEHDLLIHVEHEHEHGDHGHKHADAHGHDPHIWLGIEQAKAMVNVIRDKLSEAAPEHKEAYKKNAEAYVKKLEALHQYGKEKFAGKENKRIVATHDSLRYFAESFGLKVVDNLMPRPGVEAGGKKLTDLVKLSTDEKAPVRAITVEPQYTQKTAETLLKQIKVELKNKKLSEDKAPVLVTFDTLETAPTSDFQADLYLTKMRENIDNLAKALK